MKFVIVCLVVTLVQLSLQQESFIKVLPRVENSMLPVNKIAKQCGGKGILHSQRSTACSNPECKNFSPISFIMETDFQPSKDIAKIKWKASFMLNGLGPLIIDTEIPNAPPLKAGTNYTIQAVSQIDESTKGKDETKFEIYDGAGDDKTADLCIQAKYEWH